MRNIPQNLISLDIETASPTDDKELALDPRRNIITKIALYSNRDSGVFDCIENLPPLEESIIVTHGGKFDFKTLISKGSRLTVDDLAHDTLSMAVTFPHKIPDEWLAEYEVGRKRINEALGKNVHREAGKHSLKTLAPYFLGVEPFWETEDHANDEYVLKDAKYTYDLAQFFLREFTDEQFAFYERLQRWTRMLLRAEIKGATLDFKKLGEHEIASELKEKEAREQLEKEWSEHFYEYKKLQELTIIEDYQAKLQKAVAKLKDPTPEKQTKTAARYNELQDKAAAKIEPFNLGSPTQLKWLFKERMGVDIKTFSGDDESTGRAVLERLAGEKVPGVETFLKWRKANKLITAFFPSYRSMSFNGKIHTNYNTNGTRTGRLSSSSPNLQQIPKDVMDIFCAPEGKKLIYRDVSAIEPRLIAYETEDPNLCRIFLEGSDFHSFNVRAALQIDEDDATIKTTYKAERDLMKEVGLALMYGAGWRRIQECAAKRGFKWTEKFCKQLYRRFAGTYERVWEFKEALEGSIRGGEIITNILGRPLSYDMERLHMQSLNTKIQSGGSDIVLESAARAEIMAKERGIDFQPILFIHDAIVAESVDKDAQAGYDLLGEAISSWEFDTVWGRIPLLSEGAIYKNLPAKG
jgi:DNA polymerase I-like protein with 3'-5' exonuclease and polymerase domains